MCSTIASFIITESCAINAPVETVWEEFKTFQFEKLAPSIISSVKFLKGKPFDIGSTYQVYQVDDIKATYKIVELSEIDKSISIELTDCFPKECFCHIISTIKLSKVSFDKTTYLLWESLLPYNVNIEIVRAKKERIKLLLKEFKNYFEKKTVKNI